MTAYWIRKKTKNNLQVYRCSKCKFEKEIMHPAKGKRKLRKDGLPTRFYCPMCKEEIAYR